MNASKIRVTGVPIHLFSSKSHMQAKVMHWTLKPQENDAYRP